MSESNAASTKKNILNAIFNNKKMGIKVMYLDAILAKDNLTHIVNDNVMKIYYAYKHCYSQLSNELAKDYPEEVQYTNPEWQDKIVKFILDKKESGHTSCLEQGSVTFVITGSRTMSHQLVRTRVGVGIAQNSQRYTSVERDSEIVPESMLKLFEKNSDIESRYNTTMINVYDLYSKLVDLDIPKEDARFVLMQGVKTSIQMTFNFAALYRFFEMRLCNRAQWEIRNVAKMMATLMQNHYPGLFNNVGPRCQYLGWCPEHKGCGKYLPKKDVTVISNTLLKELTNVRQDTMVIDKYKEIIDALQNDKEQLVKENEQYVETIKKLSFCIATGTPLDFEYRKNPWTKNPNE